MLILAAFFIRWAVVQLLQENNAIMTHPYKKNNARKWPLLAAVMMTSSLLCGAAALAAEKPQADGEWHVRLSVTADDGRKDDANVFGWLKDSVAGQDSHDLPEMPPPPSPMGDRYLSIVFPHPEWKTEMPDYASDFHAVSSGAGDLWKFEVRTHTPGIKAMLTWTGPNEVLQHSRIKDAASGKVLAENCATTTSLPVQLSKEPLALIWEYLGQNSPAEAQKK